MILPAISSHRLLKKATALFVAASFLFSNIAFAETPKSSSTDVKQQTQITTDPAKVVIPRDYGMVKSRYSAGESKKLVVHIQDAHCNYEAQSNIIKILECLIKNDGLGLVSVEGADGFIDTSWFKAFPDADIRKEVADYFMKKGEITGPEFLSITSNYPIKLFGAETRAYYLDNLNAFTSSYPLKDDTEKYFNQIKAALNKLKTTIYSEELKEFDAKSQDYETKKVTFTDYIKYLEELSGKYKLNMRQYDNLFKLVSVLVYEKKINFNVVDKERSTLIDAITKKLDKDQLAELVNKSLEFKMGKISSAEYYDYIKTLSSKYGIALSNDYPNLFNYIIYNSVYSRIENENLFKDIKKFEVALKEKLFANDEQRTLDKLSHHINILLGLVNIRLLNDDFDYYKARQEEFAHEVFASFIEKMAAKFGFAFKVDSPSDAVRESMSKLEDFYRIAIKRDRALVENTIQAMKKETAQISVLVTGGFHSEGITKLLEEQGVSYIVVCPNITKDVETPYIKILTNQRTPLEDILSDTAASTKDAKSAKGNLLAPYLITAARINGISDLTIAARTETDIKGWADMCLEEWLPEARAVLAKRLGREPTREMLVAQFGIDANASIDQERLSPEEERMARGHVAFIVKYAVPGIIAELMKGQAPGDDLKRGDVYLSSKFLDYCSKKIKDLVKAVPDLRARMLGYREWIKAEIEPQEARLKAMEKSASKEDILALKTKIEKARKAKIAELDAIIRKQYNARLMEKEAGYDDSALTEGNVFSEIPGLDTFIADKQLSARYTEKAEDLTLGQDGEFTCTMDLFAGAASRLFGEGQNVDPGLSFAAHDVYAVARSHGWTDEKLAGGIEGVSLLTRLMVQERIYLEELLRKRYGSGGAYTIGERAARITYKKPRMVLVNNESGRSVIEEFVKNNFYGHNPELVVFVTQEAYNGFELDDKNAPVVADNTKPTPAGHGSGTMQFLMPGQGFCADRTGKIKRIEGKSAREYLKGKVNIKAYIESRVNDLLKLDYTLVRHPALSIRETDISIFAFALYQMGQGHNMVLEVVNQDPNNPIKGSSPLKVGDKRFAIETLAQSDRVQGLVTREGRPINRFYVFFNDTGLDILRERGLPVEFRFRDGYIYPETVTSDATMLPGMSPMWIQEATRKITDYKDDKNLTYAIPAAKKQDADPAFRSHLERLNRERHDVALTGLETVPGFEGKSSGARKLSGPRNKPSPDMADEVQQAPRVRRTGPIDPENLPLEYAEDLIKFVEKNTTIRLGAGFDEHPERVLEERASSACGSGGIHESFTKDCFLSEIARHCRDYEQFENRLDLLKSFVAKIAKHKEEPLFDSIGHKNTSLGLYYFFFACRLAKTDDDELKIIMGSLEKIIFVASKRNLYVRWSSDALYFLEAAFRSSKNASELSDFIDFVVEMAELVGTSPDFSSDDGIPPPTWARVFEQARQDGIFDDPYFRAIVKRMVSLYRRGSVCWHLSEARRHLKLLSATMSFKPLVDSAKDIEKRSGGFDVFFMPSVENREWTGKWEEGVPKDDYTAIYGSVPVNYEVLYITSGPLKISDGNLLGLTEQPQFQVHEARLDFVGQYAWNIWKERGAPYDSPVEDRKRDWEQAESKLNELIKQQAAKVWARRGRPEHSTREQTDADWLKAEREVLGIDPDPSIPKRQSLWKSLFSDGPSIRMNGGPLVGYEHRGGPGREESNVNAAIERLIKAGRATLVAEASGRVALSQELHRNLPLGATFKHLGVNLIIIQDLRKELSRIDVAPDLVFHPGSSRNAAYMDEADFTYLLTLPNGIDLIVEAIKHEKTHIDSPDLSEADVEKLAPTVNIRKALMARDTGNKDIRMQEIPGEELSIKRVFGTNGIRGDDIGIDAQRRIAAGAAQVLKAQWQKENPGKELPWLMVGFDPRPQGVNGFNPGEMGESKAVAEVLVASGFKVVFVPKPIAAPFMIAMTGKGIHPRNIYASVMRTASHNEVIDPKSGKQVSGVKIFINNAPASDAVTGLISERINDRALAQYAPRVDFDKAVSEGRIAVVTEGDSNDPDAIEFNRLNRSFDLTKLGESFRKRYPEFKIAINTMNGGMSNFALKVFKTMGFVEGKDFTAFNTVFMNDRSIESKVTGWVEYKDPSTGEDKKVRFAPDPTRPWMRGEDYTKYVASDPMRIIALLIDGDADRLVAELKKEIIPNEIGMLAAYYLAKYKGQTGRIVRTVPTTGGFDALAKALKLGEVSVTPVGSKWFAGPNKYYNGTLNDILVAVEESGHIGFVKNKELFFDHSIGLAMLMLEMAAETGKTWQELSDEMWDFITRQTGQQRITAPRYGIGKDDGAENYYDLVARLGSPKEDVFRKEFGSIFEQELASAGIPWKVEGFDITDSGGAQFKFVGGRKLFPRKSGTDGSIRMYVEVLESEKDKAPELVKVMRNVMDRFVVPAGNVPQADVRTIATFVHDEATIMRSNAAGERARKLAEGIFAKAQPADAKKHLIFVKSAIPEEQLSSTTAINLATYCAGYYNDMEGYTADIVDTYEKAVELLAKNPSWDKTNTIVGLIDKESLDKMTATLKTSGMEGKTKLLPMERFDKDQFVPLKGFFDLMSVLVQINRPLDKPEDRELKDAIKELLDQIGVKDVNDLVNALSVAAYFEDPVKFAKNFIIRLLPPTRAASPAELRERYNAAKKVVESL